MGLSESLEKVIGIVEKLEIIESQRTDVLNLARFLRAQALCDQDRRVSQAEITTAARLFVKRLHEVAIIASLKQPQQFWNSLEMFAHEQLHITVSPARVQTPKDWNIGDFFERLLILVGGDRNTPAREICRKHLQILISESSKPRERRDVPRDRKLWTSFVHPYLRSEGHLQAFQADKLLIAKLDFHLKAEWKKKESPTLLRESAKPD